MAPHQPAGAGEGAAAYPLVLLFLQLVLGFLQLLLDLLDMFVHLADGGVQNLPGVKPGEGLRGCQYSLLCTSSNVSALVCPHLVNS